VLLLCGEVDALRTEVQRLLCSTWTFITNSKPSCRCHAPEVLGDWL
jgi:hypothetical protein